MELLGMKHDKGSAIFAYFELALSMSLVGTTVVVGKMLATTLPVFLSSGLILLVALVVSGALMVLKKERIPRMSLPDFAPIFLTAFFGTFLYRIIFFYGLRNANGIESAVINSTMPAVAAILSYFLLQEKISAAKAFGIVAAIVGIALATLPDFSSAQTAGSSLFGLFLVFASVVFQCSFVVLPKPAANKIGPITLSFLIIATSFALFLPFMASDLTSFDFHMLDLTAISLIIYYGVFTTIVTYLLWFDGLSKVDASAAGVFTSFVPISGILLSVAMLGEKLTAFGIAGLVCVLIGIYLTAKGESKKKTQADAKK